MSNSAVSIPVALLFVLLTGISFDSVMPPAQASEDASFLGSRVLIYCGHSSNCGVAWSLVETHYTNMGAQVHQRSSWPADFNQYRLSFFVLSSDPFTPAQMADLRDYLEHGGRLVLVGEMNSYWSHASVFNQLMVDLGIELSFDSNALYGGGGQTASTFNPDDITEDLSYLVFGYSCSISVSGNSRWLVKAGGGEVIAAVDQYPGTPSRPGHDVVVFGDANFFNDQLYSTENSQLWTNLYDFTPEVVRTQITLAGQQFVTKGQMAFEVCYTNVSTEIIGDNETLNGQLRALLFANGKSAGDYSDLLEPIPTLSPGAVFCDSFTVNVPPTAKTKKVQAILRVPMRAEIRVQIDGVANEASPSYRAFRIEERDTNDEYWLIGNDEGHDIDMSDGWGGTAIPFYEIGPPDGTFGNEGFFGLSFPNHTGQAIGVYGVPPLNGGSDAEILGVDISVADFDPSSTVDARWGLYPNHPGQIWPDLSHPYLYGPIDPVDWNPTDGGDHGIHISWSGLSIPAGEPIWSIYFFKDGRSDGWGWDNPDGTQSGAGFVDYRSTYVSDNDFSTGAWHMPGNWIVAFRVYDSQDAFPTPGGDQALSFEGWKESVLPKLEKLPVTVTPWPGSTH